MRKLKKIFFVPIFALCIYFIYCAPVNATSIAEQVRNGKIELDNNNIVTDKYLSGAFDDFILGLTSYDSREFHNIHVFHQQKTSTCWANSGLMALTLSMEDSGQRKIYIFKKTCCIFSKWKYGRK